MSTLELAISAGCVGFAVGSLAFVAHVIRAYGRDVQAEPVRVRRVVDKAPYERLDNILSK